MTRARALGPAVVVAAIVVVLLALAAPAGAHGDTGTMGIEVTPASPAGEPPRVRVRVLLEYANDRDVAPGATVVATATGPDGATVGPVPLTDRGQGRYDTEVTLPVAGSWTVTVTATNPTASASAGISLEPATTSLVPGTTTPGTSADGIDTSSDRIARDPTASSDDGAGTSPVLLAVIAIAVVAVAAGVVTLVRRR
jgi:hypothetical protein